MRGALCIIGRKQGLTGIIPAYAGSTLSFVVLSSCQGDHPRVCGEHLMLAARRVAQSGSSPRMRGAHYEHVGVLEVVGIIPAYAGST